MKKLQLEGTLGGFPLYQNDFTFLQEATQEAIAAVAQAFGADFLVLKTQVNLGGIYQAGIIYFEGEIYDIAPISAALIGSKTIHIVTNHTALDPTIYKDNTIKNVHEIRSMEWLDPSGSPEDTGMTSSQLGFQYLERVLAEKLMTSTRLLSLLADDVNFVSKLTKQGSQVPLFMENIADNGWTNSSMQLGASMNELELVQYRRHGDRIEWRGVLEYTGGLSDPTMISGVPTIARPSMDKGQAIGFRSTGIYAASVHIRAAGSIQLIWNYNGSNPRIYLDGLTYQNRN